MGAPPLRYLNAADVVAAMPPIEERLALARRTMIALVDSADLPPKLGVHPRQPAAHTAAMPALLRGVDEDGTDDLMGVKWVTAFPGNRAQGLAAVHATVVLSDAMTGETRAILDGAPITAVRTAAISGVALREWWPPSAGGRGTSVAVIGAGVQGSSHVRVIAHIAPPGTALTIEDRHADRAEALAGHASETGVFAEVISTTDIEAAVSGADVVLTMVSFGPQRQNVPAAAFRHARLIVAVDYDMTVPASVVAAARLFVTDDVAQLDATRTDDVFAGYPQPDASIGQFLTGSAPALRDRGPIVVNHLGVGLGDVVFADAIVRRAERMGIGTELAR